MRLKRESHMPNNREKGILGENIARDYLAKKGYRIVEKNYRTKVGEIDLIAEKDNILVFVEVKSRTTTSFGLPCEAVNRKKLNRIVKASHVYIKQNGYKDYQVRYDVIEVFLSGDVRINHIENVLYT